MRGILLSTSTTYRWLALCCMLAMATFRAYAQDYSILLHAGAYTPKADIQQFFSPGGKASASLFEDHYYVLLQFQQVPTQAEALAIKQSGIILDDYIPHHAYLAAVPVSMDFAHLEMLHVRSIEAIPATAKIAESLKEKQSGKVDIILTYFDHLLPEKAALLLQLPGITFLEKPSSFHYFKLRVDADAIKTIASQPWVKWIEPVPGPLKPADYPGATLHKVNLLQSRVKGLPGLTGKNVNVGLFDVGMPSHIDFINRIQYLHGYGSSHATWCGGILAGQGIMDVNDLGMAPQANLYAWDSAGSILDTLDNNYTKYSLRIASNSLGAASSSNSYNSASARLDDLARRDPLLTQVWAAGNSGYFYQTLWPGYACSKNAITVGAIDKDTILSLSSRGPTTDGRLKPDITFYGYDVYIPDFPNVFYERESGTSMSVPAVSGSIALMIERYRQINGGKDPSGTLIKSLVLNTANDKGNPGPDYLYGYGNMNTYQAVKAIEKATYKEDSLSQKDTIRIKISAAGSSARLKIMLNWADVKGSTTASTPLVNDIDLQLITPSGKVLLPWVLDPNSPSKKAIRGVDSVNVAEQITIDTPASGTYTALIIGKSIPKGPQKFALSWENDVKGLRITSPIGGEAFSYKLPSYETIYSEDTNSMSINWESEGLYQPFDIYFSGDSGSTWKKIGQAKANQHTFYWTVPDSVTRKALIKISCGSFSSISDSVFTIMQAPHIYLLQACVNRVVVNWYKSKNADSYDVFRLNYATGTYSIVGNTKNLTFTDTTVTPNTTYWYSLRAIAANKAQSNRAIGVTTTTKGNYCFATDDAGIIAIDSPTNYCGAASRGVYVRMVNYGSSTLKSATINWTLNGTAKTAYSWTGSLSAGQVTAVKIGSFVPSSGNTYSISAWTNAPNGVNDGDHGNDSFSRGGMKQGISGTYTIGKTGADYNSFGAAIKELMQYGLCGPVVYNVLDGTYNEQITINNVPGSSANNTITFQSKSGDSTKVIISQPTTTFSTAQKAIIVLDSGQWISFKKLTIQLIDTKGYSAGRLVDLKNNADNNIFTHCRFIGIKPSYYLDQQKHIYATGIDTNNVFSYNIFKYGAGECLSLQGTSSKYSGGNVFRNNIIDSFYGNTPVSFSFQDKLQFVANSIINSQSTQGTNTTGFIYCRSTRIIGNKIIHPDAKAGYGIYLLYSGGAAASSPTVVANNFVSIGGSGTLYGGIYNLGSSYINIYFNNVLITNTYSSAYGIYDANTSTSSANNIMNNCVANTGGGQAVYVYGSGVSKIDYNNWYVNSSTLGTWFGSSSTACSNLAAWKTASSKDKYALSVDPFYKSNTDLHVYDTLLIKAGSAITGISDDIDGDSRASSPCIGADEFTLPAYDAGIYKIDSPFFSFCGGPAKIYVSLKNYGSKALTSVKVNWSVNGVLQSPYSWTGSIASLSSSSIAIGTLNMSRSIIYRIKAWTSGPSGYTDGNNFNDTAEESNYKAAMTGVYTIGGSTPDYKSFNDAVNDLTLRGVCSPVIFKIRDGSYYERIKPGYIKGVSAVNTITFQSQSNDSTKAILYYSISNADDSGIVFLNSTQWFIFKQITFTRTGTASFLTANLVGMHNACNNTFTRCRFIGVRDIPYYFNCQHINSFNSLDTNNVISDNVFKYGSYRGISLSGPSAQSSSNNIIRHNIIDSFYGYMPIYANAQKGLVITGNTITNTLGAYAMPACSLSNCTSIVFTKNKLLLPGTYNSHGVYLSTCSGTASSPGLVANNFISVTGTGAFTAGIYSTASPYLNIYNNNINITNNTSTAFGLYEGTSSSGSAGTINIKNNCVVNTGGGQAVLLTYKAINSLDNNNWYVPSTSSYLGSIDSSGVKKEANLAAWQKVTAMDANALSLDPKYKSVTDLHVVASALYKAGAAISSIIDDIDGDSRATTPCIGADEFKVYAVDAGVISIDSPYVNYCGGSRNVYVGLFNYGTSTLTSATINWSINGVTQTPYSWSGSVSASTRSSIKIGTFSPGSNNVYNIRAWTTKPNGITDPNTINDSSSIYTLRQGMSGTYTLGGTSPDYKSFKEAAADLMKRGVCGPVIINVRNGSYTEKLRINNITGVSAVNTVTFKSQSGDSSKVSLNYPTSTIDDSAVLYLNNVQWLVFKQITLQRTGSTIRKYGQITYLHNACNITFTHCRSLGLQDAASNTQQGHVYANATLDTGNVFDNNLYRFGSYYAININGTSSSYNSGNVFKNNLIDSFYGYYAVTINYQNKLLFAGNTIQNITNGGGTGICNFTYCDRVSIIKNRLLLLNDGSGYGILIGYSKGKSASDPCTIANNFISTSGNASITAAILSYSNSYMNIVFNNINIANAYKSAYGIYESSAAASKTNNVLNNCVVNTGGGQAAYILATGINKVDYNNWYVAGSSLGTWSSGSTTTICADLAKWQSTSKQDSFALSVDPKYISATDLHIKNLILCGAGTPVSPVADDIDAEKRFDPPYIGADEQKQFADAGVSGIDTTLKITCEGKRDVSISLTDFVSITLKKATINWTVDGVLQTPYLWTGAIKGKNIKSGIIIGSYTFKTGKHIIKAWTTGANSTIDTSAANDTAKLTISVNPYPAAKAGKNTTICSGATTTIGDVAVSGNTYAWTSKPKGFTSTASNPAVSPTVNTMYYMTETVKATGCAKLDSVLIKVNPSPKAKVATAKSICLNDSANIGVAAVAGNSYSWASKPAGYTNTIANPMVSPGVTTRYILTQTIDSSGCSNKDSILLTILPRPKPAISGKTDVCVGKTMVYHTPANKGDSYQWSLNGGKVIGNTIKDSIVIRWDQTGTYHIKILETNASNCQDSVAIDVTVNPVPTVTVTGQKLICAGISSTYLGKQNAGCTYAWKISNGSIIGSANNDNVVVKWANTGNRGRLTLVETNTSNCKDSASIDVVINPSPTPTIKGAGTACQVIPTLYNTSSNAGSNYDWTINGGYEWEAISGDSIKAYFTDTLSTSVIVKESNKYGCSATDTLKVKILSSPKTLIKGPKAICKGDAIQYKAEQHSGSTYKWTVAGGALLADSSTFINTKWPTSGKGVISLQETSARGCMLSINDTITVNALPVIKIKGNALLCKNNTEVYFVDASTGDKFQWKLSGGTILGPANLNAVTVNWDKAGNAKLRLIQSNSTGCSDSASMDIIVFDNLFPHIQGDSIVCNASTMHYSTDAHIGSAYKWSINGGTIDSGASTSSIRVIWQKNGTGQLSVEETSGGSCKQSDKIGITINPNPIGYFGVDSLKYRTYSFHARDSSQAASAYSWDYGDKNKGKGQLSQHSYTEGGKFTVSLQVINTFGCKAIHDTIINVPSLPFKLQVYPNPFKDQIQVRYTLPAETHVRITVCDVLGQELGLMSDKTMQPGDYISAITMNETLRAGVYMVVVKLDDKVYTYKVTKL